MPRHKPVITIFTADTGHTSIAEAAAASLKLKYTVKVHNVSVPGFSIYYPFYRYFPQLSQIGYKAISQKPFYQAYQKAISGSYQEQITQIIKTDQPDAIVSTYSLANYVIEQFLSKNQVPFLNLLNDPRTISPFLPTRHGLNLVFDQEAKRFCHQNLKIDPSYLVVSGWFVRPQYKSASQASVLRRLRLPQGKLNLLLATGSEGTNLVLKIIPTLLHTKKPLTVHIACGHNHRLLDTINQINQVNNLINKDSTTKLIPLPFTQNLYQYLQAADLVIGKAGPNLLFESVATLTPFFAITHISGQEDGNLDIIRQYHVGYVEENLVKANRLLNHLLNHPQELAQFKPSLKKLATHNQKAPTVLNQHLSRLLKNP